jgi:hypothetical protein
VPIDDVVERVLVATRAAAGEYGARWNWQREERKILDLCLSWLKKHPRLIAEQGAGLASDHVGRGSSTDNKADVEVHESKQREVQA